MSCTKTVVSSEALGEALRVESIPLTDGSLVYRVVIGRMVQHCCIIDAVDEKQALEIFTLLEKAVDLTVY